MTSSTRGSMGVVDWLSMKIGSLGGIVSLLRRGGQLGHGHESVRSELGQRHGVEQPADAGLDFLDRPAQVAARVLRAAVAIGHAADDLDWTFDSRTTCPTVIAAGRRVKTYPPLGPLWLVMSWCLARRWRILAKSSPGMWNSSA